MFLYRIQGANYAAYGENESRPLLHDRVSTAPRVAEATEGSLGLRLVFSLFST